METVRQLTVWEIEEYTVTQEVPYVESSIKQVVDIQKEVYTVPTVEEVTHEHAVLHDVNFGVGTGGAGGSGGSNGGAGGSLGGSNGGAGGAGGSGAGELGGYYDWQAPEPWW